MRENTILSFMKAATNHSDFIEFDVHVCKACPLARYKHSSRPPTPFSSRPTALAPKSAASLHGRCR